MSVHQSLAVEACWLGELCKCLRVEEGTVRLPRVALWAHSLIEATAL